MHMIRWKCCVSLKDKRTSEYFRKLVGVRCDEERLHKDIYGDQMLKQICNEEEVQLPYEKTNYKIIIVYMKITNHTL